MKKAESILEIILFLVALFGFAIICLNCTGSHFDQVERRCDIIPVAKGIILAHGEEKKQIKIIRHTLWGRTRTKFDE